MELPQRKFTGMPWPLDNCPVCGASPVLKKEEVWNTEFYQYVCSNEKCSKHTRAQLAYDEDGARASWFAERMDQV